MALNEQLTQLQLHFDMAKAHISELESGKKAASAKARSALQKCKTICHELRKQCVEHVKTIPVKTRVKITPTEVPVAEAPAVEAPVVKKTKRKTKI